MVNATKEFIKVKLLIKRHIKKLNLIYILQLYSHSPPIIWDAISQNEKIVINNKPTNNKL